MRATFRLEVLSAAHDREGFRCGVEALGAYLRSLASQDVRRRASACFVAIENATVVATEPGSAARKVAGYYTLAAGGVLLTDLPQALAKRLPRYPSVPIARVGRLAVDQAYQGRQLGAALLADAGLRALASEVAVFALVVDAIDAKAERFYKHLGFEHYGLAPRQLILPLARLASAANIGRSG